MAKGILRTLSLVTLLGLSSGVQAGYPNSGTVIGAAVLADQSTLVMTVPLVNSVLALANVNLQAQTALYVAPGASSTVMISLSCTQVFYEYNHYTLQEWQEFFGYGKGSDGQTYSIHMTSFGFSPSNGYTPNSGGWPLSYLVLTPTQRAQLPPSLVSAVGLVDLQLQALTASEGLTSGGPVGEVPVVRATVSRNLAPVAYAASTCGIPEGENDPWVQQGVFAVVGGGSGTDFGL